ncbi:asparaginase [Chengkuizengella axinellae]|uniref:Asparaginase n=1 Tax=Chengkuizengella axinellae TaxID=3064388 RepID=A0ABT9IVG8_9BACL|nr:asparaginase [Chengkuizengella sp. 2205SS18-9]MDP5273337.1 asparaginase [Chengkuizengella sp. 2205SS18-9]
MTTLIHVKRGSMIESLHDGYIAVSNSDGKLQYYLGDPHYKTYARSTAKLLQAIPIMEEVLNTDIELSDEEIAVICSSHNGESEHVRAVQSILTKINLNHSQLLCGEQKPLHKETRERLLRENVQFTSLHNTCSGKHAGMLLLSKLLNCPLNSYLSVEHPVQQIMLETIKEMTGAKTSEINIAKDGCGVPVFGITVHQLATAFAKLGSPTSLAERKKQACEKIVHAVSLQPFYIAGTERFDTHLIQATKGRILGKMGNEGVFALTIPSEDLGIAIKVSDGAERASYPSAVEILSQLGLLSSHEKQELTRFHYPIIKNRRNENVGRLEPVFKLHRV